jgi:2-alkyl-3-oxoalkanoate reductase
MDDLRSVAVTGAAGFLGGHLVAGLRARGVRVLPIVRELDPRSPEGSQTMTGVLREPGVLGGIDALIHAAAIRHRHGIEPHAYVASNVELLRGLIDAAASRVRRFVFVSSVGVYGFPKSLPITERSPFAPRTFYSQTKVDAEKLARQLAAARGLELTIVRPTIVYGPNDDGMLAKLASMIRAGRYLVVGEGKNTLHHLHVDDAVEGIRRASLLPAAAGEDLILAGPETITLEDLSRLVGSAVGVPIPRIHVPSWLARAVATAVEVAKYREFSFAHRELPVQHDKLDVMTLSIAFDISKARALIGFEPRVHYAEGIARTLSPL